MNVFICIPTNTERIFDKISKVKRQLEQDYGEEVIVLPLIDSTHFNSMLNYLAVDLNNIAKADLVYVAKGWQDSRECRIECMCALEYSKQVVFEDELCEDFPKE